MPHFLEAIGKDVRYALRMLRNSPSFTLVAVLSLALGIGANSAIFTLVDSLLLKSLPVTQPQQLVELQNDNGSWTNPQWESVRDNQAVFDGVLSYSTARFNRAQGGETQFIQGLRTSGSFFKVLGVPAIVGRTYGPEDDRRGCDGNGLVAVLSYGYWQTAFGADPNVLGQRISLDGHAFNIIGVARQGFFGPTVGNTFDVAIPLCSEAVLRGAENSLDQRSSWWLTILGRVKPSTTMDQARAGFRNLEPTVRDATYPPTYSAQDRLGYLKEPFDIKPAATGVSYMRTRYEKPLYVLMTVVALVLLVACANVANLLLARSEARSKELAVRVSLGASRGSLVRQLLIESLVLGFLGAAGGFLIAQWASRLLVTRLNTGVSTVFLDLGVDWRVLGFTTAAGILTGILFGVFPALRAARRAPNDALRERSQGSSMSGGHAGRWLVAFQVGLSLVLLFGAALFLRSYTKLLAVDPGFQSAHVLVANADLRLTGVPPDQRIRQYDEILRALRSLPGVQSAAYSAVTPISGSTWMSTIKVEGKAIRSQRDSGLYLNYISGDYFKTMGTALIAGRDLTEHETQPVAILNESAARKYYFGKEAVGQTFSTYINYPSWTDILIVGVVRDAKYRSLRDPAPATAYIAMNQQKKPGAFLSFSLKSAAAPGTLTPAIVRAATGIQKDISVTFRTLESQVDDSLVQERLMATLSALFGALALTVAAIGLAGLVAYSVSRRRAEIGIRAALGATPGSLVRLVLAEVAVLTFIGLITGTLMSLGASGFISTMLYGLDADDPITLAGAAVVLGLAALLAGYIPARRAARIDPMECLRTE